MQVEIFDKIYIINFYSFSGITREQYSAAKHGEQLHFICRPYEERNWPAQPEEAEPEPAQLQPEPAHQAQPDPEPEQLQPEPEPEQQLQPEPEPAEDPLDITFDIAHRQADDDPEPMDT